jgi:hypothetical protein
MEQALGSALPRGTHIEAMNEPDIPFNGIALNKDCAPNNTLIQGPADCAARYFADEVSVNEGRNSGMVAVAGTFSNALTTGSGDAVYGSTCTTGGFASRTMCWLRNGDGAGGIPHGNCCLKSYAGNAAHWSFHDYGDPEDSGACTPSNTGACHPDREPLGFHNLLGNWGYPNNDVWITESGYTHGWQFSPGTANPYCSYISNQGNVNCTFGNEANEAYSWVDMKNTSPYVQHLFWYEYATPNLVGQEREDSFDSALVDGNNQTRPGWCVLAYGYNSWGSCSG